MLFNVNDRKGRKIVFEARMLKEIDKLYFVERIGLATVSHKRLINRS